MKSIRCFRCGSIVGEIASGSKLKPGLRYLCCTSPEEMRATAKAFGENRKSKPEPASDALDMLKKMMGME
jgi:hypothetical protein